ncbi:hypothetical protein EKO04_009379 [Ascochyta lentis]|uniref:Sulfhydryl oxidase n=1 Tax=Ascochyta lentis TaxID=205686 RepID=A0A8H7MEY3_9PLEO|nr:hypothetical protein EKO04_009379 [Ascochyta lentis]
MIRTSGPRSRFAILALLLFAALTFLFLGPYKAQLPSAASLTHDGQQQSRSSGDGQALLTGHAIAPKLGNATAKAELGRAAWKLMHTTFARFPERPTDDEKEALRSYVHLFQRLYPCGECAEHFGQVLKKYPPQVSSQKAAAQWGCFVHNVVNKRLKKAEFDCDEIASHYDCGCADEEKEPKAA